MTNKEALDLIQHKLDLAVDDASIMTDKEYEAFSLCAKALEKESRKRGTDIKMVIDVPKSVDLDLVLKASQFAVYRYIEEGSKMFAIDIGTDCRTIDWVDVINALAELREEIENDKRTSKA